jgi:hypothetical protein
LTRGRIEELCYWHLENPLEAPILWRAFVHLHAKSNGGGFHVGIGRRKGGIRRLLQRDQREEYK